MPISREPVIDRAWYLAGPMSGIPQFNYPRFFKAAEELRNVHGLRIISPAEQDSDEKLEQILASPDGDLSAITVDVGTWADFLAHDVKLIADQVTGIIFIDGWERSRGARLEAFIGILCKRDFARWVPGVGIEEMSPLSVLTQLTRETHTEIRNGY